MVRAHGSDYVPTPPIDADDAERPIVGALLGPVPVAVDEIIRQAGLAPAAVQTVLLELELAGRLERHAGGRVSLGRSARLDDHTRRAPSSRVQTGEKSPRTPLVLDRKSVG